MILLRQPHLTLLNWPPIYSDLPTTPTGIIQKLESRVVNSQRSLSSHVTLMQDHAHSPRKIKCLSLWQLAWNYCCFLPSYLMSRDANVFLTKVIKNLEQKNSRSPPCEYVVVPGGLLTIYCPFNTQECCHGSLRYGVIDS